MALTCSVDAPDGESPPTSGISKVSSSNRSSRATSRRARPPTRGPSELVMAVHRPATTEAVSPRPTLRQEASLATASSTANARSGASKSRCSKHAVDHRPDRGASGHVGQPQPDVASDLAQQARRLRHDGDRQHLLVDRHRRLGLTPDGGLLVHGPGDARVRRSAPLGVQGAVEARCLELGRRTGVDLPVHVGRRADPFDRNAGAERLRLRLHVGVLADLGSVGRHQAVRFAVEEQPGQRGVLAVRRAGPPQHGLVPGPGQGDVAEAQVLASPLLELQLLVLHESRPFVAHVDRPTHVVVGIVEDGHVAPTRSSRPT